MSVFPLRAGPAGLRGAALAERRAQQPGAARPTPSCRDAQAPRGRQWAAAAHPEEGGGGGGGGGDPAVQEELLRMLRAGVSAERSRERLQEDVRQIMEGEKERLRRKTEEAKEEVDRLQQLMRDRSALETNSALADINQSADEFDEQLRQSRARLESRQAEFQAWEQQVVRDQSMGQFFQQLYRPAKQAGGQQQQQQQRGAAEGGAGAGSPPPQEGASDEPGQPAAAAVQGAAASAVRSPTRAWIFFFLSLNLSALCAADLLSETPSLAADAGYALLALALGASALWERRHFQSGPGGRGP